MIVGGVAVLYLLFTHKEIAHAGGYTFLGVLVFLIGLLIRRSAVTVSAKKAKKTRGEHKSWIMNERDDE